MDDFALFFGLAILGSILMVVYRIVLVVRVFRMVRSGLDQWKNLPEDQKVALVQRLSTMSPIRRSSVSDSYMPVREEMAGLAASNGIDPSFLYK